MEKLLTLRDILELLGISYSSLRRWMNEQTFPPSVSGRGKKLLWTESSIKSWMNQQSTPVNVSTSLVTTLPKQRKTDDAAYQAARAALERHRVGKVK